MCLGKEGREREGKGGEREEREWNEGEG